MGRYDSNFLNVMSSAEDDISGDLVKLSHGLVGGSNEMTRDCENMGWIVLQDVLDSQFPSL
jgi:hypothetical protein